MEHSLLMIKTTMLFLYSCLTRCLPKNWRNGGEQHPILLIERIWIK